MDRAGGLDCELRVEALGSVLDLHRDQEALQGADEVCSLVRFGLEIRSIGQDEELHDRSRELDFGRRVGDRECDDDHVAILGLGRLDDAALDTDFVHAFGDNFGFGNREIDVDHDEDSEIVARIRASPKDSGFGMEGKAKGSVTSISSSCRVERTY